MCLTVTHIQQTFGKKGQSKYVQHFSHIAGKRVKPYSSEQAVTLNKMTIQNELPAILSLHQQNESQNEGKIKTTGSNFHR